MGSDSHVFYRGMNKTFPVAVESKGVFITDRTGKTYLDASGGPLVVNIGHGRPELARAAHDQIMACTYTHPTMFTTEPVEELARRLARHTPEGIDRFYFLSSGSEAVEAAIKLARQIHLEQGHPQRTRLISRWDSFHGLSLGALSATGRKPFRNPFLPLLPDTIHIPAPFCFRCPFGLSQPGCDLACARALETAILKAGPDTVSAFIMETVSGASLAAALPPPGYLSAIRQICDRFQVLLILDEVLCGLGRCGTWFALDDFQVIPDIMTLGKGLGGGAIAISALGVLNTHYNTLRHGSKNFVHGGTFSHHNVAAAVAKTVLQILEQEDLVAAAARKGALLGQKLTTALASHPRVGDIRGKGMLWGVELVQDPDTQAPFPQKRQYAQTIWQTLFDNGVLTYTSTGFVQGDGDAILLGPPFILEESHMDQIVEALCKALDDH